MLSTDNHSITTTDNPSTTPIDNPSATTTEKQPQNHQYNNHRTTSIKSTESQYNNVL
jgi:hypothetical protein